MTTLLVIATALAALLVLSLAWVIGRLLRPEASAGGLDPIVGPPDRIAVYRPSGPLIQPHPAVRVSMPDHLKTRAEMVAWLTTELPRLVERAKR